MSDRKDSNSCQPVESGVTISGRLLDELRILVNACALGEQRRRLLAALTPETGNERRA